jgi:hypothetical protein
MLLDFGSGELLAAGVDPLVMVDEFLLPSERLRLPHPGPVVP